MAARRVIGLRAAALQLEQLINGAPATDRSSIEQLDAAGVHIGQQVQIQIVLMLGAALQQQAALVVEMGLKPLACLVGNDFEDVIRLADAADFVDHLVHLERRLRWPPLSQYVTMASSPSIRRGVLWDCYDKYYGKDDPDFLVAKGATRDFNPLGPQAMVDRALKLDPYQNRAEYLAEFLESREKFVDRAAVEACIAKGMFERPWTYGTSYFCFIDPSTGTGPDSFTLCIGHVRRA